MMPIAILFAASVHVLTLAEAVTNAEQHQPQIMRARAVTETARAQADEIRAPLLPQLTGNINYQRTTANFAPRPGAVPSAINMAQASSFSTFDYFSFGLQLNQLVYDFGQTWSRWRASQARIDAQAKSELDVRRVVRAQVEIAFFAARAQKSLVGVAAETAANQDRHLAQIAGFVRVGTRPEIDVLQAKTDLANAKVQLIQAENGYRSAKASLNQAMGIEGSIDYEVGDETRQPVSSEDESLDQQLEKSLARRPDMASLEQQIVAQKLVISSQKSTLWGPSISASMGLTDAGTDITNLAWNWNVAGALTWPLFTGLLHWSQLREQRAVLDNLTAQRDILRLQVRLEVEQARLSLSAAKETLGAAGEALDNARQRLRLAEGRYQTGIGSVIELGDAQLAVTGAGAQKVQAEYNLASARVQLARALGID